MITKRNFNIVKISFICLILLGVITFGVLLSTPTGIVAAEDYSGSGSMSNPYVIYNAKGLEELWIEANSDKHFELGGDIDMSGSTYQGTFAPCYLDGKGYAIKNYTLVKEGSSGFFASLSSATIKNVVFDNVKIEANSQPSKAFAGLLAASATDVLCYNISIKSSCSITSTGLAGGFFATLNGNSKILNSKSYADVKGLSAGGIVGNSASSLALVANYGKVEGQENVGGIVAATLNSAGVEYCCNYGNIIAKETYTLSGGIVGNTSENTTLKGLFSATVPVREKGTDTTSGLSALLFAYDKTATATIPSGSGLYSKCEDSDYENNVTNSAVKITDIYARSFLLPNLLPSPEHWSMQNGVNPLGDTWSVGSLVENSYPSLTAFADKISVETKESYSEGIIQKTYTGSSLTPTAKGTFLSGTQIGEDYNGVYTYFYQGQTFYGEDYPLTNTPPTKAGNYTIFVCPYNEGILGYGVFSFRIKRADLDLGLFKIEDCIKVYNGTAQHMDITYQDGTLPDWQALTGEQPTYVYERKAGESAWDGVPSSMAKDVGVYRITATIMGGNNYNNTTLPTKPLITVTQAPLQVTVDDKTILFGATFPPLTVSVGGFVASDSVSNCKNYSSPTAKYDTNGLQNPYYAGTYSARLVVDKWGSAYNYSFFTYTQRTEEYIIQECIEEKDLFVCIGGTYIPYDSTNGSHVGIAKFTRVYNMTAGTLVISPAEMSGITFDSDSTAIYTGNPYFLVARGTFPEGYSLSYTLTDGTNPQGTPSSTPITATEAGVYHFRVTVTATNYLQKVLDADLNIAKASIEGLSFPSLSGVFDGENKSTAIVGSLPQGTSLLYGLEGEESKKSTPFEFKDVGVYSLTADVDGGNNYKNITLTATVTITKLFLRLVSEDMGSVYGEPVVSSEDMTLYCYDGKGNYVDISDKKLGDLNPVLSCSSQNKAGEYAIKILLGDTKNHSVTLDEGTYTIEKKRLSVSVDPPPITYNSEIPDFELIYNGFVLGEDENDLTVLPTCTTDAKKGSNVGEYKVSISGGVADNYEFYYYNGYLAIRRINLENVIFESKTVVYTGEAIALAVSNPVEVLNYIYENNEGNKNVGSYTVTLRIPISTNYYEYEAQAKLTIQKAKIVYYAPTETAIYGDAYYPILLTKQCENGEYLDSYDRELAPSFECDVTAQNATTMGANNYVISVNYTKNESNTKNYSVKIIEGTYLIKKADLTLTLSIEDGTFGEEYPDCIISYSGFRGGEDESIFGDNPPVIVGMPEANANAGSYNLSLEGGVANNYNLIFVGTTFTIVQGSFGAEYLLPHKSFVFDGTPKAIQVVRKDGGEISFPEGVTPEYRNMQQINTGTYTVSVVLAGNPNYLTCTLEATMTITPAPLTIEGVTATRRDYDGTTEVVLSGGVLMLNDEPLGDSRVGFVLGSGYTDTKVAEKNKPVTTSIILSGTEADNYYLIQPDYVKADIDTIPMQILGLKAIDRRYNQSLVVYLDFSQLEFAGILDGDYVDLDKDKEGTYGLLSSLAVSKNNQKLPVTINDDTITYLGEDYINYHLLTVDYVGVLITTGSLFTAEGNEFFVDEEAQSLINPSFADVLTYDGDTKTLTIPDYSFTGENFLVDLFAGIPQGVVVEVEGEGITAKEVDIASFEIRNAGDYDILVKIRSVEGFFDAEDLHLKFSVGAKTITIEGVTAVTRDYDGTKVMNLLGGELVGVVEGDEVNFKLHQGLSEYKDVGTNIVVTTFITLGGAKCSNYVLEQPLVYGEITKKILTIEGVAAISRDYDATDIIELVGGNLIGIIGSENVSFALGKGVAADINSGSNIGVTTFITLTGNDSYNYGITQPVLTVNIEKKKVIVRAIDTWCYQNKPIPKFQFETEGLLGEDKVEGEPLVSVTEPEMNATYTIEIGTLSVNDNYYIEYVSATLTVKIPIYIWVLGSMGGALFVVLILLLVIYIRKKKREITPCGDLRELDDYDTPENRGNNSGTSGGNNRELANDEEEKKAVNKVSEKAEINQEKPGKTAESKIKVNSVQKENNSQSATNSNKKERDNVVMDKSQTLGSKGYPNYAEGKSNINQKTSNFGIKVESTDDFNVDERFNPYDYEFEEVEEKKESGESNKPYYYNDAENLIIDAGDYGEYVENAQNIPEISSQIEVNSAKVTKSEVIDDKKNLADKNADISNVREIFDEKEEQEESPTKYQESKRYYDFFAENIPEQKQRVIEDDADLVAENSEISDNNNFAEKGNNIHEYTDLTDKKSEISENTELVEAEREIPENEDNVRIYDYYDEEDVDLVEEDGEMEIAEEEIDSEIPDNTDLVAEDSEIPENSDFAEEEREIPENEDKASIYGHFDEEDVDLVEDDSEREIDEDEIDSELPENTELVEEESEIFRRTDFAEEEREIPENEDKMPTEEYFDEEDVDLVEEDSERVIDEDEIDSETPDNTDFAEEESEIPENEQNEEGDNDEEGSFEDSDYGLYDEEDYSNRRVIEDDDEEDNIQENNTQDRVALIEYDDEEENADSDADDDTTADSFNPYDYD